MRTPCRPYFKLFGSSALAVLVSTVSVGYSKKGQDLAGPAALQARPFNYPAPPSEGDANYFPIAEDGAARCVVVAATNQQASSKALQAYLQRVTGAQIQLISDGTPVPTNMAAIHVGDTTVSTLIPLNLPDLHYGADTFPNLNGYLVQTVDERTLVIRGLTAKAVQLGVVGFLRRYAGVRQYWEGAPGSLGEVVPSRPSLYVPHVTWRDWPYFFSRWISQRPFTPSRGSLDFFRRNGTLPCGENYYELMPPAQYAKTHPEYFCMINGQRVIPADDQHSAWQPCLSNPHVARIMADAVIDYFRKNPTAVGKNVSINDGGRDCTCDACQAMDTPNAPHNKRMSDRYLKFTGRVCEFVAREFPDKHIVYLAYGMANHPPLTAKLHPMILPVMTVNNAFQGWDRWMAADPAHMGLYLHHNDGLYFILPKMDVRQAARRIQYIVSTGRARVFYFESYPHWPLAGLVPYVTAELLWDPRQNVDDLLNEFYTNFFGPAAEPMKEFYETLIDGYEDWLAQKGIVHSTGTDITSTTDGRSFRQFSTLSAAAASRAADALNKAGALAVNDAVIARRVEAVQRLFTIVASCVESYWLTDKLNSAQVQSEADARRTIANARRMFVLSRIMAEHIATDLDHTPSDLYGAVFSQLDNKRPIELYEALKTGQPPPEVIGGIRKGADAAGAWLQRERGTAGAMQWWDSVLAVETEPELNAIFEMARLNSGAGELKPIYQSNFDAIGANLAPADLDLIAGDQEIVIDNFMASGRTNNYLGHGKLQGTGFSVYAWFPDRTPFTLALTRQHTPGDTFALMLHHSNRSRMSCHIPITKEQRRFRVGFNFKRTEASGHYSAEVWCRLADRNRATVAVLHLPDAPDTWHEIADNVEVPEGSDLLFLQIFAEAQAPDAKCWVHDVFIAEYVQPKAE